MAVLKCKMCGGDIEVSEDKTFGTCDSCGSTMTFPKIDDEQRANMFNRGNHFRRIGEFDKALAVYERIVQEDESDAEAHWCCVLCRFGIEYVEDPFTFEFIPTCHRASFDSILEDVDYLAAVEHSGGVTRRQYQKEAAKISEIQKGILATSQNEEPFDVFICYKESEDDGTRTHDSTYAQDIYYQLTEQGWRVFFSRITLEDKAGTEYEPYIFAALNSAKVMVIVTTSEEHANAVWVKNEWSRFLALMRKDRFKLLIPCYRDMDPYDLPEALSVLQSYDMNKIGFIQDLIRGINKVLEAGKEKENVVVQQVSSGADTQNLLRRGYMSLEDKDWEKAKELFDKVLNIDAENADAYLGMMLAEKQFVDKEAFSKAFISGKEKADRRFERAKQFSSNSLSVWFSDIERKRAEEITRQEKQMKEAAERRKLEEEQKKQAEIEKEQNRLAILAERRKQIAPVQSFINASEKFTVGLKSDGTVVTAGETRHLYKNQWVSWDCSNWKGVTAVSSGIEHIVGLKADGTVFSGGKNGNNQCDVAEWKNISAISAEFQNTAGLKADGTVVATARDQGSIKDWTDIVSISAGSSTTMGLKADGTVVTVGGHSRWKSDRAKIGLWRNIVAVSAGVYHYVGLRADGTVVAVVEDGWHLEPGMVNQWKDIIAISAGTNHTVGLKADGTVVAVGINTYGQCDVKDWNEIVAISAGTSHTVGLKADGTVVAVGCSDDGQCDVKDWKLFGSIETVVQELSEAREKEYTDSVKEYENLKNELANLKGLFSGKKRAEIETRLAELENIIKLNAD